MNQINLDKLFQLSPGTKTEPAVLKLVVAQVYQAQVQQLTNGQFGLQLPAARAPLQITLPANLPANVQAMLQASLQTQSNVQTALTGTPGMATPNPLSHTVPRQANVQLQFVPQSNGQLQLVLQSASAPVTLALSAVQAQQLLSSVLSAGVPGSAAQPALVTPIAVNILPQQQGLALQLGNTVLRLPANVQAALMQQLAGSSAAGSLAGDSKTAPPQLLLDIKAERQQLVLQLHILPANSKAGATTVANSNLTAIPLSLNKTGQSAILQQLLQLFNQPARSTTAIPAAAQQFLSQLPVSGGVNIGSQPYQMHLQQQAGQWQLLLQPLKTPASVTITAEALSRPLQFNSNSTAAVVKAAKPIMQTPLTQQLVQQAWRHLLPLMPVQADTLASLPELPQAVQQILQLVRQSQPGADKVQSPQQLINQLTSLLQFQPLQPAPSAQTSGGALAAAIQLLLGHLLQKPLSAATQPANKPLAQLISQLEPGQASNLLRQLAGHSSTLQQSQLATLDNNPQTQQLLLQLPIQQGGQSVFSQLLLEQREADGKQQGEKQTLWQLTMKFDLKQLGQLMVVAKLQQQQLQLQFYTDEVQAKQQADKFLPLLSDRCKAQGLEVTQVECTLGKIPDTILPRANSLLAIKV